MIGHTLLMSGVMNSLQPSTQTPSASIAPRLCVGSADDMYCWISVLSAGNTCKGGRLVARMSTMRKTVKRYEQDLAAFEADRHKYINVSIPTDSWR